MAELSKKEADEIEAVEKKRWKKKSKSLNTISNNIHRLRRKVTTDLKSSDEKTRLTALIVAIMDKTAERVGNNDSASDGHFGVTGFRKKHIQVVGNKVTLKYIGKSGVDHDKSFTDEKIAKGLKQAIKNSPNNDIFVTSEGFKVQADKINRYLKNHEITAKDIRGYSANNLVATALKALGKVDDKDRQKEYNKVVKSVAEKVGHGAATLKKHYLHPKVEKEFLSNGKVFNIKKASEEANPTMKIVKQLLILAKAIIDED